MNIQWMQPYLENFLLILFSFVITLISAAMLELRKQVLAWIDGKTSNEQRELLHRLAEEAFSFAEKVFHHVDGPKKLEAAMQYLQGRTQEHGLTLSETELRALVEKAVCDRQPPQTSNRRSD